MMENKDLIIGNTTILPGRILNRIMSYLISPLNTAIEENVADENNNNNNNNNTSSDYAERVTTDFPHPVR